MPCSFYILSRQVRGHFPNVIHPRAGHTPKAGHPKNYQESENLYLNILTIA